MNKTSSIEYLYKTPARIRFLVSTFGNDKGDVVRVEQENDYEVDYYDSFHRQCYLLKSEEGKVYEYIPKGQRLKK